MKIMKCISGNILEELNFQQMLLYRVLLLRAAAVAADCVAASCGALFRKYSFKMSHFFTILSRAGVNVNHLEWTCLMNRLSSKSIWKSICTSR